MEGRGRDPIDEEPRVEVGEGYPLGQMAKALATALEHDDPETRARAATRAGKWADVLKGMASGLLSVGSRDPVMGLPVWVTPEVIRGGFVTGNVEAGGPVEISERLVARRADVAPTREAIFAWYLTEAGLTELVSKLEQGSYAVPIPESAALLTVAWLAASGHTEEAVGLVAELRPFADQLSFAPAEDDPDPLPPSIVFRQSAGQTGQALAQRKPNARVEAMREALTVWNPLSDEALSLWLETIEDGKVASVFGRDWDQRGADLLSRYRSFAVAHTRATKHRRPKENLAIMLAALSERVEGGSLSARRRGLLQHAIDSMVRRRGRPGSSDHAELRGAQQSNARQPAHHAIARVVASRIGALPASRGVRDIEPLLAPVGPGEHAEVPPGTPIPRSIQRVVARSLADTPETLIERRVVPSAEVLAELVPRIAAATVATSYPDRALRDLMAANYEAFRRRRSLLLLDLERQVGVEELPWVRAVKRFRRGDDAATADAGATAARLAELSLEAFPATILPNPLVTELQALIKEAGLELPLVEEVAADIFMGSFSAKFLGAAQLAGELLRGSLYERYYGIDYEAILRIDDLSRGRFGARTSPAFDKLCETRSDDGSEDHGGFSVAANGKVIEQAQILTTHNLAALTGPFGLGQIMSFDWGALAGRCVQRVVALNARLEKNPRPLSTVKDIAYAWRQMLFFLSRAPERAADESVEAIVARIDSMGDAESARLRPAVEGLVTVYRGGTLDDPASSGRRLLGWTTGNHWMLRAQQRR